MLRESWGDPNYAITGTFDDREQIRELYARYAFTIDHGPYEDWVKCFTEDGVFESPRLGRHEGTRRAASSFTAIYKNRLAGRRCVT